MNRGLPMPPKPDLHQIRKRVRCYACKEIGHFSRDCPKKKFRPRPAGRGADVRFVGCEPCPEREALATAAVPSDPWAEIDEIISYWDMEEWERPLEDEAQILYGHSPGAGVPDTGCGASAIGEETLRRHADQEGEEIQWAPDASPMVFPRFRQPLPDAHRSVRAPAADRQGQGASARTRCSRQLQPSYPQACAEVAGSSD